MIRYFFLAFLIVVLSSGCQTQKALTPAFYQKYPEPIFPAINFYVMRPSAKLTETCSEKNCSINPQILDSMYGQLQKSGVFKGVEAGASADNQYGVHIATRFYSAGNLAGELANATLTGATLLLVPMVEKLEYQSEFVVTWQGLKLAEYSFTTPFERKTSLYNTPAEQNDLIGEKIVAEFIAAAQGDDVFSSERIYSVLKAEDYHRDLKSPVQVGDYRHRDFYLYPDPRAGVQLRYENQKSSKEVVDLFVYPIRELDWSDSEKVAQDEINLAIKDVDLAVKGGGYKSAKFEMPKMISFGEKNSINKGWVSKGEVIWSDGKTSTDYLYVFAMKDKYLKFRFSLFESQMVEPLNDFVAGVLKAIVVPDESYFMASLRQRQRGSTLK